MAPPLKELDAPQPTPTTTSWREAIDNPRLMIAVLFLVTAATGLPLLWMSRGFSLASKIFLTILVLLWTVLIFWAFYLVMAWCIPRILEPFQTA